MLPHVNHAHVSHMLTANLTWEKITILCETQSSHMTFSEFHIENFFTCKMIILTCKMFQFYIKFHMSNYKWIFTENYGNYSYDKRTGWYTSLYVLPSTLKMRYFLVNQWKLTVDHLCETIIHRFHHGNLTCGDRCKYLRDEAQTRRFHAYSRLHNTPYSPKPPLERNQKRSEPERRSNLRIKTFLPMRIDMTIIQNSLIFIIILLETLGYPYFYFMKHFI